MRRRLFALLVVLAGLVVVFGALPARSQDGEEQSFLVTINAYRVQNNVAPLTESLILDNVARWMVNDMATNNYFSHTDSLGRDPFTRMDAMGYGYNTWRGENLVAVTDTAAYAFQYWSESPEHNANMLNPHYTVIGIARFYNAGSAYGWYWATEFGGVGVVAPIPPSPVPIPIDLPTLPPTALPSPLPVATAAPICGAP
jgi:Cysteine-rich secretory protein family